MITDNSGDQIDTKESAFECNICMLIASNPVVTSCGHLFCWACIYHWLRSNQQFLTCPVCKNGIQTSKLIPVFKMDYLLGQNQKDIDKFLTQHQQDLDCRIIFQMQVQIYIKEFFLQVMDYFLHYQYYYFKSVTMQILNNQFKVLLKNRINVY